MDDIKIGSKVYKVKIEKDDDCGPPWEWSDCHGPVIGWTRDKKKPGQMILAKDCGMHLLYDFKEACEIARTEWGFPARKEAAEVAIKDFKRLKAFCDGGWHYVTLFVEDYEGNSDCIGGMESDDESGIEEYAKSLARGLYESEFVPQPDLFDKETQ